jgi:hypothetical protein
VTPDSQLLKTRMRTNGATSWRLNLGLLVTAGFVFVSHGFAQQQPAADKPYELKGETPGLTTLKQFKANHKHADCTGSPALQLSCRVYGWISFAGRSGAGVKGCIFGDECADQGILASFNGGVLVSLTYGVMPFGEDGIYDALTEKFGKPTSQDNKGRYPSYTWKNSVGYLSLSTSYARDSNGNIRPDATTITSSLNDTTIRVKGDI